MKFEELLEKSIFDELYEKECNDFEQYIVRRNKIDKDFCNDAKVQEEIIGIIEKTYLDDSTKDQINEKLEEYEKVTLKEYEYWVKKYFKLGIINGIRLKNEILSNIKMVDDTLFFSNNSDNLNEYIENIRINKVMRNEQYKKLKEKASALKEKYPRVERFLEDRDYIENLTSEEQNAIFEIMDIYDQIFIIEEKEIYKMGMKEIINL